MDGASRTRNSWGSRGRLAAAAAVLAALAALGFPRPAPAHWEPAAQVDSGGGDFRATWLDSALAAGSNGLTTSLFFQATSGTPGGQVGNAYAIRRARGSSWTTPAAVSSPAGFADTFVRLDLAAESDGGTLGLFTFRDSSSKRIGIASPWPADSSAPGAATPAVCADTGPECSTDPPQVAVDGAGNGYAVAGAGVGGDLVLARRDAATGTWGPAVTVANGGAPQIAVNAAGDVVIAYTRLDNSNPALAVRHVFAKRRLAGEPAFGPEVQVSGPNTVDTAGHAVVIDDSGSATIIFPEDTLPPGGGVTPAAPVIKAAIWPRASATPGGGGAISNQADGQARFAVAAVDSEGRVTAAWQSFAGHFGIFSAELGDSDWSQPQHVSPEGESRNATSPKVAVDPAGTATIVYGDAAAPQGGDVDVKVSRRPTGGAWSTPQSLRFTGPGAGAVAGSSPRLAAGFTGQADATFVQQVNGTNRLFATRFDHGGYPRPLSASPVSVSLVPAYKECTSPNEIHGPPLAFGSCAPPAQRSSHVTVGTFDANGESPQSIGSVRLAAVVGDPDPGADEADARISVSLTDVRRKGNLSDYTGELQAVATARVTDRDEGSSASEPSTVADFDLPATIPCVATPDASTGAACSAATTFNALMPGAVSEGNRAVWQLGQVQVLDGGGDGDVDTEPNTVFAVQGIFVP